MGKDANSLIASIHPQAQLSEWRAAKPRGSGPPHGWQHRRPPPRLHSGCSGWYAYPNRVAVLNPIPLDKVKVDSFTTREDVLYSDIEALQVSGSTIKTNPGVWGGGFGVIGAATGILAATVINTMAARTRQYAVLRIVTGSSEYVFSSSSRDGSALSLTLTPVQVEIRKAQQAKVASVTAPPPPPSPVSLADELTKLARLRAEGVLSDEEFASAKAKLLVVCL